MYLINHRTVLGPVIFGFTFLATMMFSIGAWVPTYFIRTHGMTASEIGGIVGVYFMLFGAAGVICGGLFSDWLRSRGYYDSNLRAGLFSALVSLPFVVTFPLVGDKTPVSRIVRTRHLLRHDAVWNRPCRIAFDRAESPARPIDRGLSSVR